MKWELEARKARFAALGAAVAAAIAACATAAFLLCACAAVALACDTWVALPDATAPRVTILAKNSDRTSFDCQPLVFHPRAKWPAGATIDLGRTSIPQARETFATLGSSPYWCWGYEEGINEFGVSIGNEGVFTKPLVEDIKAARRGEGPPPGPTGMDLLRLGLERGRTAREALDVIVKILEKHGQFGSGMPTAGVEAAYDNSFLIADPREAWILETAGRQWAARRVASGTASISNALSIGGAWDRSSKDLVVHAVAKGWWKEGEERSFHFASAYSDTSPDVAAQRLRAETRAGCSAGLLAEKRGDVDPFWMMRIARDRSTSPSIDLDVTASSCVAVLPKGEGNIAVFWWCPAVPSTSCYAPFFVESGGVPEIVSRAGTFGKRVVDPSTAARDSFAEDSYWWLFRDLFELVNKSWDERQPIAREAFDSLESDFAAGLGPALDEARRLRRGGSGEAASRVLAAYSARCVERATRKARELRARFSAAPAGGAAVVEERFRPYVGEYVADFGGFKNAAFTVLVRGGRLAVDIPGQMTVDLAEPDDEGIRRLILTDRAAFSFAMGEDGLASALRLHQTTVLRKAADTLAAPSSAAADSIPPSLRPFVGRYELPAARLTVAVRFTEGGLALDIPNEGLVPLDPPDAKGRRYFKGDPDTYLVFDVDASGAATGIRIRQIFTLPRK